MGFFSRYNRLCVSIIVEMRKNYQHLGVQCTVELFTHQRNGETRSLITNQQTHKERKGKTEDQHATPCLKVRQSTRNSVLESKSVCPIMPTTYFTLFASYCS